MLYGIDVSKWNGTIDWNKVKTDFVIIKTTQKNNTVEPKFEEYYAGALAAGLAIGGYRYVYAKTVEEAKAEANAVVKVLNGRKLPAMFWIDMEDKTIKGIGKAMLTQIIETEAAILEAAGITVGIYCNKDWYNNVLDSAYLSTKYKFWIARYPIFDNGTVKESLSPKAYAELWQYSSKGKVDGISGNVDLNVAYVDFIIKDLLPSTPETKEEAVTPKGDKFPLKKGNTGDNVLWVKQMLGYKFSIAVGNVDSNYDQNTENAVKEFQLLYGLQVDGIVGPATKKALEGMEKVIPHNKYAYKLQRMLNAELDARLVCDGKMGSKTINACPIIKYNQHSQVIQVYKEILAYFYGYKISVSTGTFTKEIVVATKDLQKKKKLTQDGCVGPKTWKAISKDLFK